MNGKAISERLRALATDDTKRSKAARLRDVFDDVEAALAAGVSRSTVVDELAKLGLSMSLATFETTLKRIRLKRSKEPKAAAATVRQSPSAAAPETQTGSGKPENGSHDPADLDKIISSTPDLTALAKHAKRGHKK